MQPRDIDVLVAARAGAILSALDQLERMLYPLQPLLMTSANREGQLLRLHGIDSGQATNCTVRSDRLGALLSLETSSNLGRQGFQERTIPRLLSRAHIRVDLTTSKQIVHVAREAGRRWGPITAG